MRVDVADAAYLRIEAEIPVGGDDREMIAEIYGHSRLAEDEEVRIAAAAERHVPAGRGEARKVGIGRADPAADVGLDQRGDRKLDEAVDRRRVKIAVAAAQDRGRPA